MHTIIVACHVDATADHVQRYLIKVKGKVHPRTSHECPEGE